MTFNEMNVYAGINQALLNYPLSNASYKNLVWENLPVPDILHNVYTPAIVRLEN